MAVYCVTIVGDEEAMRNGSRERGTTTRMERGISNVEMPKNGDFDYDEDDMEGVLKYDEADNQRGGGGGVVLQER